MKYMGSKARIAKHILPIILKDIKEGQWYVEPFIDKQGKSGKLPVSKINVLGAKRYVNILIEIALICNRGPF